MPLLRDVTPASDSAASLRWFFKVDVADAVVSALGRELGGGPQRLDAVAGDAGDLVGDGAQLLYDTGLRRGELSLVDRAMVDLEDELLRIPTAIQKDFPNDRSPPPATFELDRSEQLDVVATLQAYLQQRDDDHAALFPSQKSPRLSGKAINDAVKRVAETADVRPYSFSGRVGPGCSRTYPSSNAMFPLPSGIR